MVKETVTAQDPRRPQGTDSPVGTLSCLEEWTAGFPRKSPKALLRSVIVRKSILELT